MKFSQRESILAMATCAVLVFGGSAVVIKSKLEGYRDLRRKENELAGKIQRYNEIAAEKDLWTGKLAELKNMMPEHPAEKKMDVHWLSIMDSLASRHSVKILKRQVGEEKQVGDVYELPIECKEWEGNLSSIVHFLFDLQNEGAMLDIRQLQIKPKTADNLRGYFSLYCAYARQSKKQK